MVTCNVTFVIISIYYLLSGVEYAVILPTLNNYLLYLGAEPFFIGLVMSSFSLTGLISAPIYGRFSDVTHSTKIPVCLSNLFEIGGNFMYFAATSPYMVLGSRLVAGLGSGSGSSIFGMISRSTTNEERTAAFSRLMALRQIGIVIGPAFNLLLEKLDFYIGPFHVNSLTVPGLFMAILWIIHTFLMLFCYRELEIGSKTNKVIVDNDQSEKNGLEDETLDGHQENSSYRERAPSAFFSYVVSDLLREEVVVCLSVTFTIMFVQTGVETLVTPMTRQLLNWGETLNSVFYCVAGVLVILSFVALALLSKKVSDRFMLFVGLCVMAIYYVGFLIFIYFAVKVPVGTTWVLIGLVLLSMVLVLDLPFAWVPQAALYSKFTSERTQSFNQGIRLLVMGLGQILGPLWAASLLDNLPVMAAVNLGMVVFVLVLVCLSYKRLKVPDESSNRNDVNPEVSERTPLISGGNSSHAINA